MSVACTFLCETDKKNTISASIGIFHSENHGVELIHSSYDCCVTRHVICNLEEEMVAGGARNELIFKSCLRSRFDIICVSKPDGK